MAIMIPNELVQNTNALSRTNGEASHGLVEDKSAKTRRSIRPSSNSVCNPIGRATTNTRPGDVEANSQVGLKILTAMWPASSILTPLQKTRTAPNSSFSTAQARVSDTWRRLVMPPLNIKNIWTTYKTICALAVTINSVVALAFFVHSHSLPSHVTMANAISLNLMIAILARQEDCVNILYEIAVSVPKSAPLWIRCRLAQVFHYGGVHSGCGMGAFLWVVLQAVSILQTARMVHQISTTQRVANVLSGMVVLGLVVVIMSALPGIRRKWHNSFEVYHRFGGWVTLLIFWCHTCIGSHTSTDAMYLMRSLNFWCLSVSTTCGILSWSRLRRRQVTPEPLSDHAIRLHFDYRQMPPFYGIKVSNRPLLEWHSFATIPDDGGGFSILISNAGDWTKETITHPPRSLWVRGAPVHGVSFAATLFRRVVVVATGSGIGPILSLLASRTTPCRILWSARRPDRTYGPSIVHAVRTADPRANIWDTDLQGRPDLVKEAAHLVADFCAEAVFVLSNRAVTKTVLRDLADRHIPTFGVLFDS